MPVLAACFLIVLVLLCYLAVAAKTTTRRAMAVVGVVLLQLTTVFLKQVLARGSSSAADQGVEAMRAGMFFHQIRPVDRIGMYRRTEVKAMKMSIPGGGDDE